MKTLEELKEKFTRLRLSGHFMTGYEVDHNKIWQFIEEAIKEERAILYTYTVKIENEHWSTYRFILNAKDDEEAIAIATKEYDLSPAITAIEIEGKYRVMSGLIRAEGFED